MNIIEYIDAYFQKTLSEEERKVFEIRCEQDKAFAEEVAFYITARQSVHEELLEQKQTAWQTKPKEDELSILPFIKKSFTGRWFAYAAAACLVLAASVYLFETNSSPKRLADNYLKTNYSNLGITMSGEKDSLTLGQAAYNNKQYDRALQLFKGIEKNDASNSDAKKYAGLAYLQKNEYDSALMQFEVLAQMQNLFSNPGDFLKAVTLLERNKPGDKKEAKKLLQRVVNEREAENDKAAQWLKKI